MTTWRYNINPDSPEQYRYKWNLEHPATLLTSSDKTWPALNNFKQVNVGDEIAVYFKNVGGGLPDAIRVIGDVIAVDRAEKCFTWRPNKKRTALTLATPLLKDEQASFFGRAFGSAMRRLPAARQKAWDLRVGRKSAVVKGVPSASLNKKPSAAGWNPVASKANGLKGELHVVARLRVEFPASKGFKVVHVAAKNPTEDHDIEVRKGKTLVLVVEVKTRADEAGNAPVLISERELRCRRRSKGMHRISIVYLGHKGRVSRVLEINEADAYELSPRQYWLVPGTP